ncbi:hypothetical protein Vretimale_12466, partial [Volvox reticuliferus]
GSGLGTMASGACLQVPRKGPASAEFLGEPSEQEDFSNLQALLESSVRDTDGQNPVSKMAKPGSGSDKEAACTGRASSGHGGAAGSRAVEDEESSGTRLCTGAVKDKAWFLKSMQTTTQ